LKRIGIPYFDLIVLSWVISSLRCQNPKLSGFRNHELCSQERPFSPIFMCYNFKKAPTNAEAINLKRQMCSYSSANATGSTISTETALPSFMAGVHFGILSMMSNAAASSSGLKDLPIVASPAVPSSAIKNLT